MFLRGVLFSAMIVALPSASIWADIIVSGFFSGTIERFDEQTGAQSTFASLSSATDPFPGLSSVAYSSSNNVVYASARISNRIYTMDGTTGAVLGFHQLAAGVLPTSIAVDGAGNIFVANNASSDIIVFDSSFNQINTLTIPDVGAGLNFPSGLAFDGPNRLIVSTFAGAGLFEYNVTSGTFSSLAPSPLANGQVAINALGEIFVGGAAFSNDVLRFSNDGTAAGNPFITIDSGILPLPGQGFTSPDFTSPSGVAIDADGNIIVAALGRTNPTSGADNFQSNGGLFRFAPDGTLLTTFGTNLTPFSSVAIIPNAIPEPNAAAALILLSGVMASRIRRRK